MTPAVNQLWLTDARLWVVVAVDPFDRTLTLGFLDDLAAIDRSSWDSVLGYFKNRPQKPHYTRAVPPAYLDPPARLVGRWSDTITSDLGLGPRPGPRTGPAGPS